MALLKHEIKCVNCDEHYFVVVKEDGESPGYCPICSDPLEDESIVDGD